MATCKCGHQLTDISGIKFHVMPERLTDDEFALFLARKRSVRNPSRDCVLLEAENNDV